MPWAHVFFFYYSAGGVERIKRTYLAEVLEVLLRQNQVGSTIGT